MVPGVTCLNGLINNKVEAVKDKMKEMLAATRKVTIGTDIWAKKGLTMSFVGISAAFYDPKRGSAVHVMHNLHKIPHPHTGESIAQKLQMSISEWEINPNKILMIITDNGSNMLKAITVLREWDDNQTDDHDENNAGDISTTDDSPDRDDESAHNNAMGVVMENYHHLPCLAHSLQLVTHHLNKSAPYNNIMTKAQA